MSSITEITVFSGSNNWYYSAFGNIYDIRFPFVFVIAAKFSGGLCYNCYAHGFKNGVFVGFCAECIDTKYGFERGNGMLPGCIERCEWNSGSYYDPKFSVWNTYMKNATSDEIGCEKLKEEHDLFMVSLHSAQQSKNVIDLDSDMEKDIENVKQEQQEPPEPLEQLVEPLEQQEQIQIQALQSAIEIGHISVRDRLTHTAMVCGNN